MYKRGRGGARFCMGFLPFQGGGEGGQCYEWASDKAVWVGLAAKEWRDQVRCRVGAAMPAGQSGRAYGSWRARAAPNVARAVCFTGVWCCRRARIVARGGVVRGRRACSVVQGLSGSVVWGPSAIPTVDRSP